MIYLENTNLNLDLIYFQIWFQIIFLIATFYHYVLYFEISDYQTKYIIYIFFMNIFNDISDMTKLYKNTSDLIEI